MHLTEDGKDGGIIVSAVVGKFSGCHVELKIPGQRDVAPCLLRFWAGLISRNAAEDKCTAPSEGMEAVHGPC